MNFRCLACGERDLRRVRAYRTDTRHGKTVFGGAYLAECSACGLVQAVPRPEPRMLAEYYALDYRRGCRYGADVANVSQFPKDNLFYFNRGQSVAQLLLPYLETQNPRILDVGAGYGHILHALGQLFPKATKSAVEFSGVCVEHLRSVGVRVFSQPVEELLPRIEQKFDLVVLSHVLEHLSAPGEVLRLIHASLAPRGVLYVEVPNIPPESLIRYPDHRWAPRFEEPHISFFSLATLTRLLQSAGFERQFCDTAGPEYKYISSLRYRLPPLRSFLQSLLPRAVFFFLRRQRFMQPLHVQEREESFYQYGGFRIWIRSVWTKQEPPAQKQAS